MTKYYPVRWALYVGAYPTLSLVSLSESLNTIKHYQSVLTVF